MAQAGNLVYVAIGTIGSEVAISAYCNGADIADMVSKLDDTHFGDTRKKSAPGIGEFSPVKITGDADPTLVTTLRALLGVAGKSLIIGLAGNSTGAEKISIVGYLQKFTRKAAVAGKITFDAEFELGTTVIYATFP